MDKSIRRGVTGLAKRKRARMMRTICVILVCESFDGSCCALVSSTPLSPIIVAPRVSSRAQRWRTYDAPPAFLAVSCAFGFALSVAHEYENLFPLALLSIAVFLGAASTTTRRGFGFVLGLAFGLSCFGAGLSWLFDLLDHREAPLAATLLPLLLIGALSVPCALVGACAAGPASTRTRRLLIIVPAVWILFDWLRHQGDAAFPWFSVGYSQIGISPLSGYAPLGGVLLVGLVTVLCGALLALAASRRDLRARALLGVAALLAAGAGLKYLPWTAPAAAPLQVAVLQGNIGAAAKFDWSAQSRTLSRYESLIRSSHADVMLLPESALPLPANALAGYLGALREYAHANQTDVLLGAFEIDAAAGRRYSSAISLGVSGTQLYRKRQLVPFGDFIPWGASLYETVQRIPFADTSRGAADQFLPTLGGGRVAVAICYDDVFGERMRADAAASGWVANLSNDGWGDSRAMQRQHARMAQARAAEFGRPLLRAADTGISGLIDERGRWVDSLPLNEVGALEARLVPRSGATPYARWGDRIALVVCAGALLAAIASRTQSDRWRNSI